MTTINVTILAARIENSSRLNVANPITKAIGKALGTLGVYTIAGIAYDAGTRLFALTPAMNEWNNRWMAGENLTPATFEVEVADSLVKETGLADDED